MYVNCVESFTHIQCYSDCSRRGINYNLSAGSMSLYCVYSHVVIFGEIRLNPFATVLFTVRSAVTVECYVM